MIYIADSNWLPTKKNPFETNGEYGEGWSAFIYDLEIPYFTNVYFDAKLHTVRFSPKADENNERLFDFLNYELSYQRNVIFKVSKGMNAESIIRKFRAASNDIKYRKSDMEYMVHSTTKSAWRMINEAGALLSPNALKERGIKINEIGLEPMHEPKDYSDYIMLDVPNGCGELVVNSRNLGYVCIDPNINYQPGVRLYFDMKKMIADRIIRRDGLHLAKVKDRLPLEKYLIAAITPDDFDVTIQWTPTLFTEKANQLFKDNYLN